MKKKDIEKEEEGEAKVDALAELKDRQTFLNDLYETLKVENIRSISDLENKLARANEDVIEASK